MKRNKLKFIPTWKIKEILDSNYTTGIHGADYEEVKEELEAILWERQNKTDEKEINKMINRYNDEDKNEK